MRADLPFPLATHNTREITYLHSISNWIAWVLALVAMCTSVQAAELLNTPVYDPASKSYFEMVDGSHGLVKGPVAHEGPNWLEAYELARQRVYKGVNGRLAIVSDIDTHEFLAKTFQPNTFVWIGLRYLCAKRLLQESTGKLIGRLSFAPWAANWRGGNWICEIDPATKRPAASDFMPVAYSPISQGFRWTGIGRHKRYYYFFVEYPTGKP